MGKLPTLKEFKDEATLFIKAYKRKNTYEGITIADELEVDGKLWFIEIEKHPSKKADENEEIIDKKQIFRLCIDRYENENDEEGNHKVFEIESEDFTVTEIMDFLAFEYTRNVLKIK